MNDIRKGKSTDEKNPEKRSSLVTSGQTVHKNRYINRWSIILTNHLYYKNKVPYLVTDSSKENL
jgi:hypothetical protein